MSKPGKVYLVGAGPGDPGLLSLRGRECLQIADLILYDGLVNPIILQHAKGVCERTSRRLGESGKRVPQEEINQRLIAAAKSGKTVVRLKGGDPFVFGRGSEEAAALKQAGIRYEIVPGVTAAVAAAEYAGISVTHREHASAVAFITGHEDPGKPGSSLDYAHLAKFPGTLVFYMGLNRLAHITGSLIEHGLSAETPACVISHGTLGSQRTIEGTVGTLERRVRDQGLKAPSLIMVGDCVTLRRKLQWFEDRPLFGHRVIITRPMEQAYETAELARQYGAIPLLCPTIETIGPDCWAEIDQLIADIDQQDWLIFTSQNGVRYFFERFFELGCDLRKLGSARIAAIGSATASALRQYHAIADLVPEKFRAEELATDLTEHVTGKNVVWLGANRGREVLIDELSPHAQQFRKVVVYQHRDVERWPSDSLQALEAGDVDWIALSSPSIARGIARLLGERIESLQENDVKLVAISPVTADAAIEAGLQIHTVAKTFTWEGIFEAMTEATHNKPLAEE